jgi:hypothetical protein
MDSMDTKHRMSHRRRLISFVAAGAAAIAVAVGGFAIADSGSGSGASAATTTTATSTTATATSGKVIPFDRGNPSAAKKVGQVPAAFKAGAGKIITGAAANKAKAAAVAAYPGGTVNRVVQMSDGQYNVHIIGVNWPHHVFVDKSFNVIGAE